MMPIVGAVEAFFAIWDALPVSISSFISLVLGLFFIGVIIRVVLKL